MFVNRQMFRTWFATVQFRDTEEKSLALRFRQNIIEFNNALTSLAQATQLSELKAI
jgi:hypothetical protein